MNEEKDIIKKARIYNLIIVDESGSMHGLEHATITGVNETINSIRGAQREFADTQDHFLTLVTFDSGARASIRTIIDCKPIAQVEDFKDYHPGGCTPLYDAMGQSITTLHKLIKDDDDASAVVTVLTDGYENASHEWTGAALKALIEQLTEEGWSFSYMGSDHDVKQVSFNLSINNVLEFSHDVQGTSSSWARESSAKHNYFTKRNGLSANARCRKDIIATALLLKQSTICMRAKSSSSAAIHKASTAVELPRWRWSVLVPYGGKAKVCKDRAMLSHQPAPLKTWPKRYTVSPSLLSNIPNSASSLPAWVAASPDTTSMRWHPSSRAASTLRTLPYQPSSGKSSASSCKKSPT